MIETGFGGAYALMFESPQLLATAFPQTPSLLSSPSK